MIISISSADKLIVVDIQPGYHKFIVRDIDLHKLCDYLNGYREVLFFYNGDDSGITQDTRGDVLGYFMEHGFDPDRATRFIDKGYGFFRQVMGKVSDDKVVALIKHMIKRKAMHSDELDADEFRELADGLEPGEYPVYLPQTFCAGDLAKMSGARIIGGGRNECLKEIQLYMKALDMEYTTVSRYVYG